SRHLAAAGAAPHSAASGRERISARTVEARRSRESPDRFGAAGRHARPAGRGQRPRGSGRWRQRQRHRAAKRAGSSREALRRPIRPLRPELARGLLRAGPASHPGAGVRCGPMSQNIPVLVVDDEPAARRRVRSLLRADPDFAIVGEASDGFQAAKMIAELNPSVVFLDVQIPGADGFAVLKTLVDPKQLPVIVFVTAYREYALPAFEARAFDYILKPF